jgi:hypothetical protein
MATLLRHTNCAGWQRDGGRKSPYNAGPNAKLCVRPSTMSITLRTSFSYSVVFGPCRRSAGSAVIGMRCPTCLSSAFSRKVTLLHVFRCTHATMQHARLMRPRCRTSQPSRPYQRLAFVKHLHTGHGHLSRLESRLDGTGLENSVRSDFESTS